MKKRLLLLMVLCLMAVGAYPRYLGDVNNDGDITVTDVMTIVNIILGQATNYDYIYADLNQDGSVDVSDVMITISIILGKEQATEYVEDDTVYVTYSDGNATVVKPSKYSLVSYTVSGGHVVMVNNDTSQEITFCLSGSTADGSFTYNGSYKTTIVLNGVDITNPTGAAIDIECGKRIALELAEGTTNTLTDGTGGGQKAALYCKGHLEVSKGGALTVCGNTRHAIMSKEYMLLKKTTGSISVTAAANDGIHAGQYFQMNGGKLTVSGVAGDAIQAETTSDSTDETNGQLIVNGGEMNLTVTSADCDALKSDSLLTISGGTIDITTTGDADKGIKSKLSAVNISGGDITISQSGGKIIEADDISYSTGIKAETDANISGGNITISNLADGGKGISAGGDININESNAAVTIDITANGAGGSAELSGGGESTTTTNSYVVYVALPTTSGMGGGGMGGGMSNYWTTLYLYNSNGEKVATLTSTVTKTTGSTSKTFYYYDFHEADGGTYYFASDNYTSHRPGGGTYVIRSTTFTGPTTGEDYYYEISNSRTTSGSTYTFSLSNVTNTWNGSSTDLSEDEGTSYNASGMKADGKITIDGGTVTIKNSGAMSKSMKSKATVTLNGGEVTLTPSGAMQVISNDASYSTGVKCIDFIENGGSLTINASGAAGRGISATNIITNGGTMTVTNTGGGQQGINDSYTAKCLKADTKIELRAGDITLTATGNGGKGIKSSGTYTQGTADGAGPKLTVTTTGSSFGTSGSTGGWGPQQSSGSSAKAIKIQGTAYVYGGETNINTATNGAEGFESKTAIYIEGGKHYLKCYDDCINSSGNIYFNGGITVCFSNGNDAVDSNAGRTGAVTIGNGTIFAYTSKGAPEEGLDCDNNSYIQITGTGIAISAGGSQGGGGGGWGGSSGSTISNAKQGYYFCTSSISYTTGKYYTLSDESGKNLVTYSFPTNVSSSLALFTATGMKSGGKYYIKYSTSAPTDATTSFQGLYIGSSLVGSNSVTSFTAN